MSPQTVAAALLAAAALANPFARIFGLPVLLPLGAVLLAGYALLEWRAFGPTSRVIALLSLLGLGLVLADGGGLERIADALVLPLFLVTFLTALGLMRQVGVRSPLLRAAGRALVNQPGARRYASISLGSMLLSVILLLSVIGLVGGMAVGRKGGRALQPSQRRALVATIRGYMLMIPWSPFSMPFAVTIGAIGSIAWGGMVAITLPLLAAFWLLGWMADGLRPGPSEARPPRVRRADLRALGIVALILAGLVAAVLAVRFALGLRLIDAVLLVIPATALAWIARLRRRPGPIARGGGQGEVMILAGAAWLAGVLQPFLPAEAVSRPILEGTVPLAVVPAAVLALFLAGGLVAVPPVFVLVFLAAMIPDPAAIGLAPEILVGTCLVGWTLAATVSPFNPATLLLARVADLPSRTVSLGWNGRYIAACAVLAALYLAVLTG